MKNSPVPAAGVVVVATVITCSAERYGVPPQLALVQQFLYKSLQLVIGHSLVAVKTLLTFMEAILTTSVTAAVYTKSRMAGDQSRIFLVLASLAVELLMLLEYALFTRVPSHALSTL